MLGAGEVFEGVDEGKGGTDEIMAEHFCSLLALCPVCTFFPYFGGGQPASGGRHGFEVEEGGTGEVEGGEGLAGGGRGGEGGGSDRVERDLHLEPVAIRVDEPGEAALDDGNVCDEVVLAEGGGDATPAADGEVAAGNKGDG